jgi:hypothetical protein
MPLINTNLNGMNVDDENIAETYQGIFRALSGK